MIAQFVFNVFKLCPASVSATLPALPISYRREHHIFFVNPGGSTPFPHPWALEQELHHGDSSHRVAPGNGVKSQQAAATASRGDAILGSRCVSYYIRLLGPVAEVITHTGGREW